jgi:hypothetical protein
MPVPQSFTHLAPPPPPVRSQMDIRDNDRLGGPRGSAGAWQPFEYPPAELHRRQASVGGVGGLRVDLVSSRSLSGALSSSSLSQQRRAGGKPKPCTLRHGACHDASSCASDTM